MSNAAATIAKQTANHQIARLSVIADRAKTSGATAGRKRIARDAFAAALTALIEAEDHGATDIAWVTDNLTRDRQRAQAAGLLTTEDIFRIEGEAIA